MATHTFAFKVGSPHTRQRAASFALAIPELCGRGLHSIALGLEPSWNVFLCAVTLEEEEATTRARLDHWARRQGCLQETCDAKDAPALLAGCDVLRRDVGPGALPEALAAVLGGEHVEHAEPLSLALDLTGPDRDGLVLDRERRTLFVPGLEAPPRGDGLRLVVQAPGTLPIRCEAVVLDVVEAGESDVPAGFVLDLTGAAPDLLHDLGAVVPPPSESSRREPRHPLRIPAALTPVAGDGPPRVQRRAPPSRYPDRLEDMSTGGARVRTSLAVAPGDAVWLELPAGTEAIRIPAAVVHAPAGGVGLRFHLDRQGASEVAEVLREHLARSRHVLVVDDDPFVRRVLGDTLEEQGYEVHTAADGLAALRALADGILGTMAVVTDVHMPVMDGIELVHRIRKAGGECELGIVAVTGNAPSSLAALRCAGADEVVGKERGLSAILEAVDRVAWHARRSARGAGAPSVPVDCPVPPS